MQARTYFAADGSFGDADELVIIDTSRFTEQDWNVIINLPDGERIGYAEHLNEIIWTEGK